MVDTFIIELKGVKESKANELCKIIGSSRVSFSVTDSTGYVTLKDVDIVGKWFRIFKVSKAIHKLGLDDDITMIDVI